MGLTAAQIAASLDALGAREPRVAAAVECVAHDYATQGEDIRIDVILLAPGALPRHIANAWQP